MEETGFRVKMAQADIGNLYDKTSKGTNVVTSEETTEKINEINLDLKEKKINLSTALNKLRELVGTKYGKYRENVEREREKKEEKYV